MSKGIAIINKNIDKVLVEALSKVSEHQIEIINRVPVYMTIAKLNMKKQTTKPKPTLREEIMKSMKK